MTNVIITRHYSGFRNVADTCSLGNQERDGNAVAEAYSLPAGYSVSNGKIYDSNDIECLICIERNRVMLVSAAGNYADQMLQAA